MFKAIFFDLDETLVRAMDQHEKANEKVFLHFGIAYTEVEKRTKHHDFLGRRLQDILQIMRDAMEISEEQLPLSALTSKRQEFFLNFVQQEASLLPGAKEAVRYAKEKGKIVAITSSGTKKYINLAMDKFGFREYVDYIVGEEDVQRGKPFPDVYDKAFDLLPKEQNISKQECLVVEDSQNGVKAAKSSGLQVCFVPLFSPKEKVEADFTLPSLKEFSTIPL